MRTVVLVALILSISAHAKPAPSFRGETLAGTQVSLMDSLKKGRVLLLTFWATWCSSCMEELQHVKKQMSEHPDVPLDVLTVNVDTSETASSVAPTVRLLNVSFPVILDPKHEIFEKFQPDKSLPYSVVINEHGSLEKTFTGYQETMFSDIRTILSKRNP